MAHPLQILLIGTQSNRDGVGARVKVVAGDLTTYDQRKGGMSYQSAQDPRLHFGLGDRKQIDLIEVRWPSGMLTKPNWRSIRPDPGNQGGGGDCKILLPASDDSLGAVRRSMLPPRPPPRPST
jgi:hypothetical protein